MGVNWLVEGDVLSKYRIMLVGLMLAVVLAGCESSGRGTATTMTEKASDPEVATAPPGSATLAVVSKTSEPLDLVAWLDGKTMACIWRGKAHYSESKRSGSSHTEFSATGGRLSGYLKEVRGRGGNIPTGSLRNVSVGENSIRYTSPSGAESNIVVDTATNTGAATFESIRGAGTANCTFAPTAVAGG